MKYILYKTEKNTFCLVFGDMCYLAYDISEIIKSLKLNKKFNIKDINLKIFIHKKEYNSIEEIKYDYIEYLI